MLQNPPSNEKARRRKGCSLWEKEVWKIDIWIWRECVSENCWTQIGGMQKVASEIHRCRIEIVIQYLQFNRATFCGSVFIIFLGANFVQNFSLRWLYTQTIQKCNTGNDRLSAVLSMATATIEASFWLYIMLCKQEVILWPLGPSCDTKKSLFNHDTSIYVDTWRKISCTIR